MTSQSRKRPLSPHLQIYKPQISSVLSITHRATGAFLFVGGLLIMWLISLMFYVPALAEKVIGAMDSSVGIIIELAWISALYYHTLNGIRHLFWDIGLGFSIPNLHRSGWAVVIITLLASSATWYYVLYA